MIVNQIGAFFDLKITRLYVPIIMLLALSFSGCGAFIDFGLKDSTLELYDARIPGNDFNMMTLMIPGYQHNNPDYRYLIKFYDKDRCTGTYYAADTLQYEVEGTWSLPEPDVIKVKLDGFVDAEFDISKLDKVTYLLKTEANSHGLPIEPPQIPLDLYNRKVY